MGTLVTLEKLETLKACSSSLAFVTSSVFGVSGSLQYVTGSQSGSSAFFQEGLIYPFTCSNNTELSYLIWAADKFKLTGSLHNKETGYSLLYSTIK